MVKEEEFKVGDKVFFIHETYNFNRSPCSNTGDFIIRTSKILSIDGTLYQINASRQRFDTYHTNIVYATRKEAEKALRESFKNEISILHEEIKILNKFIDLKLLSLVRICNKSRKNRVKYYKITSLRYDLKNKKRDNL